MSAAMERTARRRAAREIGRLGALLDEVNGGPAVQAPVTEPAALDEVDRLVHVFEHGTDPEDPDEMTDDELSISEILARAEGV